MNKDITPLPKSNKSRKAVVPIRNNNADAFGTQTDTTSPAPSVICFIKQFARCYIYNSNVPHCLGGINAN